MADEDLSAVPTGLETPATELPQQAVEEPTQPETEGQPAEGDEGQQVEEFDEIEVDGQTYQVPKALKGAFMKNADYTQKTQSVAERAKALDAKETDIEERLKATDEELDQRAELRAISNQLKQYANVDWDAAEAQDPLAAQRHWRTYQQLKDRASELDTGLKSAVAKRTETAQQDLAKRIQDTLAHVNDPKNGFKPDSIKTLTEFAVNTVNMSEEQIKRNWSPGLLNLLRMAHVGHLAMTKPINAAPKPTPAPLKVVSAKSNPTNRKSPNEMSMAEMADAFKKEQAAKRA